MASGITEILLPRLYIIDREAKELGGSAHDTVPKDWRGADVKIIRVSDRVKIGDED